MKKLIFCLLFLTSVSTIKTAYAQSASAFPADYKPNLFADTTDKRGMASKIDKKTGDTLVRVNIIFSDVPAYAWKGFYSVTGPSIMTFKSFNNGHGDRDRYFSISPYVHEINYFIWVKKGDTGPYAFNYFIYQDKTVVLANSFHFKVIQNGRHTKTVLLQKPDPTGLMAANP